MYFLKTWLKPPGSFKTVPSFPGSERKNRAPGTAGYSKCSVAGPSAANPGQSGEAELPHL